MKKTIDPLRIGLATLLLALFFAPVLWAQDDDFDAIGTERAPTATKWGGVRWKTAEMQLFQGRPRTTHDSDSKNYITVAYDRFVSYYDLRQFSPCWVAYVTDKASALVSEQKKRTGKAFARPSQFFTDKVIADPTIALGLHPTTHTDYSDRVPDNLQGTDVISKTITAQKARSLPAIIERGHLAPNNTMKCWGTAQNGKDAQFESFSLANVVPQMSAHNAPTWSALEAQCLQWAKELGSVCVVAGPIYSNPAHPHHIQERRTGDALDIVCPDALFCVVIGRRNQAIVAVGFIMPHSTVKYAFASKVVPIDQIEQATGIDFMPLMGEPNVLEQNVDKSWLN